MGSKRNKFNNTQLSPLQSYLFCIRADLPLTKRLLYKELSLSNGQLYAAVDGKLRPIDGYGRKINDYGNRLFECIGIGEVIGQQFDNGELSLGLKRFLEKPENKEQAKYFFPSIKK